MNLRTFKSEVNLLKALILFLALGCSSITYTNRGVMKPYIAAHDEHLNYFETTGEVPFYLWGQIPAQQTVYLDEAIRPLGLFSAANLVVSQFRDFENWFWAVVSFGLYTPMSYSVSGYGIRFDQEQTR